MTRPLTLALTLLLIMLITVIVAHGQGDAPLTETYHSAYFHLQFDYPADWQVIDEGGGPLLVNYEYRGGGPRGMNAARLQFITSGDLTAHGIDPDTSGPVEFLDSLRPIFDRNDENSMGLVSAITIGEQPAARAEGLFRDTPTIFFAMSGPADTFTLVTGEAHEEDIAGLEPLFIQIAASTRYEPPQFAASLPPITPANAAQIARYMNLYERGQGAGQTDYVALSPDGTWAASSLGLNGLKVWDATTGDLIRYYEDVRAAQIAFSPTNDKLAAVYRRDGLQIITLVTGEVSVVASENRLRAVAFTPDGQQIVTGGDAGVLELWDAESLTIVRTLAEFPDVRIAEVSASEAWVAATHKHGQVALYPLNSDDPPIVLPVGEYLAEALAFSADGTRLAVLTTDDRYLVFDVATSDILLDERSAMENSAKSSVVLNSDGSVLAVTIAGDGLVWLIDVATGDILAELNQGGDEVSALAFSADDTLLLAGGFYDETLVLWAVP